MIRATTYTLVGCLLAIASVQAGVAAPVTYTAQPFDNVNDVSTNGTLLYAYNLGNTNAAGSVTMNGVLFSNETAGVTTLFASDFASTLLFNSTTHSVTGLSTVEADRLLDTLEFGSGVGNSLARLSGLTVGTNYEFQIIVSDQRPTGGGGTSNFGYATPSGSLTEIYPLLNVAVNTEPFIITGTFTADEMFQDLHIAGSVSSNGRANAFQLRQLAASVPEPASLVLWTLLSLCTLGVVRLRMRHRVGRGSHI